MAIIQEVISRENKHKKEHKHDDCDILVALRLLHYTHIVGKSIVGTALTEQLRIDPVVVLIEFPIVHNKSRNRHFIAHIKHYSVVNGDTVVKPLQFRCHRSVVASKHKTAFVSRMCLCKVGVDALHTTVGKHQCLDISTVDVAEIGTVSIGSSLGGKGRGKRLMSIGNPDTASSRIATSLHRLCKSRPYNNKQGNNQTQDTLRQTEENAAATPLFALCTNHALIEQTAHLAILVDYSLTVHEPETVTLSRLFVRKFLVAFHIHYRLMLKQAVQLHGRHSCPRVGNRHFDAIAQIGAADSNPASIRSELTGVVGNGVYHEKCKRTIGLHHFTAWFDTQFDAFQTIFHTALSQRVEYLLKTETLNMQTHIALPHLNPTCEHCIAGCYLCSQFRNVGVA